MTAGAVPRWPRRLGVLAPAALILLLGARAAAAQDGTIRGTVRSSVTGDPLDTPVLTILDLGRRVIGDSLGNFLFLGVPAGSWAMEARCIGYRPDTVAVTVRAAAETAVELQLRLAAITLGELRAVAPDPDRQRFEEVAQVSTHTLGVRDIASVPSLAESDLMRAVQVLPGVVARNDFSVGLNVRGGDADQNLVLLDGQVVFNPFHLGGLVSSFDNDAVREIEFLAGAFPARYGARLSSVLDVAERDGSTDRVHGSAALSLLSSKLHLEGPLPVRLGSWLVAARRTYADQVVRAFTNGEFPYYFQDLVARVTLPSVLGGVLSASGFISGDYFDLTLTQPSGGQAAQNFRFDWGNRVLGLTYHRAIGSHGHVTQRLGASRFFADAAVGPGFFSFSNRASRLAAAGELEVSHGRHLLAMGYVAERNTITYLAGSRDVAVDVARFRYRPDGVEAYIEDQWQPAPWLIARPGLRATYVPSARFARLAPRFTAKVFVGRNTALSFAAGRYFQPVQSLRNEEIPISLFEFWVGANRWIPVGAADQGVVGMERWFGQALSLAVEGYWKRMWDLVDMKPGHDPAKVGDEFETARATAYGADIYLRKTGGRVTGWVSYAVGRVTRITEGGERYAPAQDRRHTLNLVGFFAGPLGAHWSLRFGYGSPLPYTGMAGEWIHRYYDPGRNMLLGSSVEPYRTERNALRYPAYSRLDISARWRFRWLGATWWPTASLLNTYGRTNVFAYFFDYTRDPPIRRGLSQLPLLPAAGLEVEF